LACALPGGQKLFMPVMTTKTLHFETLHIHNLANNPPTPIEMNPVVNLFQK
jgi:hypothetical protein